MSSAQAAANNDSSESIKNDTKTGKPIAPSLNVLKKNGLISIDSKGAELDRVLEELSKVSGIPVKLIDPAGAKRKITVSVKNKPIQEVVRKVMETLPAGGFSSVSENDGVKTLFQIA